VSESVRSPARPLCPSGEVLHDAGTFAGVSYLLGYLRRRPRSPSRKADRDICEIARGLTDKRQMRVSTPRTVNLGRRERPFDPLSLIRPGLDKRDK